MNKLIYFSHIPKAAGLTFSSILRQNYKSKYCYFTHGFYEDFISRKCLDLQLRDNYFKAIGGHRVSFDVPYDSGFFDVYCIAYIRKPDERLYSEYHYLRKIGFTDKIYGCHTFKDFINEVDSHDRNGWYSNTQSNYQTLDPKVFDVLVESNKLLLFPVDRFDESLFVLRRLFSGLRNISFVSSNVNKSFSLETRKSDDLSIIPSYLIEKDLELYSTSNKTLDRLLSMYIPGQVERLKFKMACKLKLPMNFASSALVSLSNQIDSFGF